MLYTLITGASSGIGEEFARRLAAKKNNLIIVARSEDKLRNLADELHQAHGVDVKVFAIDLMEPKSAEKLHKLCQDLNLNVNFLINDAGVGLIGKFDEFELQRIEDMINLNVLTLTKLTYLFLPQLKQNVGRIINLASQVSFSGSPYMSAYGATKAYVLNFTEAIRVEYEKEGVKIMALCPGPTYTRFFEKTQTSPSDINFKFRQPKDVVDEALSAMESNTAIPIVGWENKVMIFMMRFMPRSLTAKMSAGFVKKKSHEHV
jgi:short-subunit dehydrogenase